MKAKREKAERDDSEDKPRDRRLKPKHLFRGVGPAIKKDDYQPRIFGNPEESLAAAFIKMKRDYGGPLPVARC